MTDEIETTRTVDDAIAWMGGLDVLVYCVGTARLGRIAELDGSDWNRLLATNVVGAAIAVGRARCRHSGGRRTRLSRSFRRTSSETRGPRWLPTRRARQPWRNWRGDYALRSRLSGC